ncbi:unnamed protein product [Calicophoron daubneyi]|uniref:Cilia- and flagella-associated protein 43 n=1 Tax=Calicophoron daubneyi TaxID=300641 RepID=A0AAV2TPB1_CALDB
MTFIWTQGAKGYQCGFIDNNVLCIRSGPSVRFINLTTNEIKVIRLPTSQPTSLAVHSIEPYFALIETSRVNPRVFVYRYPELSLTLLHGSGKLELKTIAFSNTCYLATVSGIPDFLLTLWNFKTSHMMCRTSMNHAFLKTFSFCPTNWKCLVGTDDRCMHVWQVETCNEITMLRCRSTLLPDQSIPPGVYEDRGPNKQTSADLCRLSLMSMEDTRFDPKLPESAVSGVTGDKQHEFEDYMDDRTHVACVSQTWTNGELIFLGCKYGQLLLIDPYTTAMKVLLNPLSYQSCEKGQECLTRGKSDDVYRSVSSCTCSGVIPQDGLPVPFGCLRFLLYTKHGLLAAGKDGALRLIKLEIPKTNPTLNRKGSDPLTALTGPNVNPLLVKIQAKEGRNVFSFSSVLPKESRCPAYPRIVNLVVSPSYGRIAVVSKNGLMAILTIVDDLTAIEKPLKADKEISLIGDAFVGFGLLGPSMIDFCATARRNGVINTWDCKTGELQGGIAIGEKCCSMTVSPLIPVAIAGMESGAYVVVDCSNPSSLRVVRSIKLCKRSLRFFEFDPYGEFAFTAADDECCAIVSGQPARKFDPLGFVPITGKVCDHSMLRVSDSDRLFLAVSTAQNPSDGAVDLCFFEIQPSSIYNTSLAYSDSCRTLHPDVIRLMNLHFENPTTGLCLWPSWDPTTQTPPLLFAADVNAKKLNTYLLPKEPIKKPQVHVAGGVTRSIVASVAVRQISTTASGTQVSPPARISVSQEQQAATAPPVHRMSRRPQRGPPALSLRASPTNVTTPTEPAETSTEITRRSSSLIPLTSLSILRGDRQPKFSKLLNTGLMMVCYGDGVIELVEVTSDEFTVKQTMRVHEASRAGIIGAQFCERWNTLLSCGGDGLLGRTLIEAESVDFSVPLTYLPPDILKTAEALSVALGQLKSCEAKRSLRAGRSDTTDVPSSRQQSGQHNSTAPLFFRSSTQMTLEELSVILSNSDDSESEALDIGFRLTDPHRPTWREDCEVEAQALEDQIYMSAKEQLLEDLKAIRGTIGTMIQENEQLPEIQRIGRQEFELDVDEQAAILEETENAVKQTREEIELTDLSKQYTREIIKRHCWDEMLVKGRSLFAFNTPIEVYNFPLKARTKNEMAQLNAVKARRLLHMHSRDSVNISGAIQALQHEEVDEEEEEQVEINFVMAGSTALEYGGTDELQYGQMDLYTREQKIYQIVLIKDNIYKIKEAFNKKFDEIYAKKEDTLSKIQSKLARIRKIMIDLQQGGSVKKIVDPKFAPQEQPELLLAVADNEIKVEKYLSPAQLAELESKRQAEEERIRLEKLDNWRERGLEEMMGGVLEIRKEDELKKDIPKPAFLLTNKPLGHWTEDDKRLYAEYERKVKELEEEREKYRKFLESEMKKLHGLVDEDRAKFDEQLINLFDYWLRVQTAVLQEELKIWRLKRMLLLEEELITREHELREMLAKSEDEAVHLTQILNASKEVLDQVQEQYELLCAEDRLMEKNFRKDFSDVHGPLYDYIAKAFKRRPRRAAPSAGQNRTEPEPPAGVPLHELPGSTIYNPYVEKPSFKRQITDAKAVLDDSLHDIDNDPAREGQPGMDNAVWERLCRVRRRKVEKEMEVKATGARLNEINAFVQRRENELRAAQAKRERIQNDLKELDRDYHRNQTDLELQLLAKQGQVEIEVPEGALVHDYSDAQLIHRERVELLNKRIVTLGESKVQHMIRNKEFRKRFHHLEWELRQMLMQYEDLQDKLRDIRKFKITREVQKYLESNDYDGLINAEIATIEQTMALQRQTHEKLMGKKRKRLRRYQLHHDDKLQSDNKKAAKDLKELNVAFHETKFIYDQSRCADTRQTKTTPRYQLLVQQQRLMHIANEQTKELKALRQELAMLREDSDQNKF